MTQTRGRALILSNKYEHIGKDGKMSWRKGSEHDHANMTLMLETFGFIVNGKVRNYTAQVVLHVLYQL